MEEMPGNKKESQAPRGFHFEVNSLNDVDRIAEEVSELLRKDELVLPLRISTGRDRSKPVDIESLDELFDVVSRLVERLPDQKGTIYVGTIPEKDDKEGEYSQG